jgi:uncharacterized membrane protein YfcA
LLIPTLVLLFGADIKLAGSLSLAVSLPTMLVGFERYSRDRSFVVLSDNGRFMLTMAAGSIVGSFIGGQLLGIVPSPVLLPLLAMILVRRSRSGGTNSRTQPASLPSVARNSIFLKMPLTQHAPGNIWIIVEMSRAEWTLQKRSRR